MPMMALRSTSFDPARNLAIEDCLLAGRREGESLLFLYIDDPCVVIGRNQNPWAEASAPQGGALFRRSSGGGAVWHDRGNLNWALILARSTHNRERELALVAAAISSLGVEALPGERGGIFARPSPGGAWAKLSGSARRISAASVLHHGTLLVDADLGALTAALEGRNFASSRALASAPSPVVNLADLVPSIEIEIAALGLATFLCGSPPEPVEARVPEASLEAALARQLSWDWIYGETPTFFTELPGFPGTTLEVGRGRIVSVSGPARSALSGLIGQPFDVALLGP
jgi:lipoate-protein ligase A